MADTKFMSFAEAMANSTDSVLIGNSTNGVRRAQLGNLREAIGAIAANCGGVIDYSNSNKNGYVKFANGFLVQWGASSWDNTATTLAIAYAQGYANFSIPFAIPVPDNNDKVGTVAVRGSDINGCSFGFYNEPEGGLAQRRLYWVAIGV